jgi:hypothetical protein
MLRLTGGGWVILRDSCLDAIETDLRQTPFESRAPSFAADPSR